MHFEAYGISGSQLQAECQPEQMTMGNRIIGGTSQNFLRFPCYSPPTEVVAESTDYRFTVIVVIPAFFPLIIRCAVAILSPSASLSILLDVNNKVLPEHVSLEATGLYWLCRWIHIQRYCHISVRRTSDRFGFSGCSS